MKLFSLLCISITIPVEINTRLQQMHLAYNFYYYCKSYFMRSLLYLVAVILVIGWLIGFFAYSVGGIIHVLLILAIVSILLGVIRRSGD
jgi:hypothetical protein